MLCMYIVVLVIRLLIECSQYNQYKIDESVYNHTDIQTYKRVTVECQHFKRMSDIRGKQKAITKQLDNNYIDNKEIILD